LRKIPHILLFIIIMLLIGSIGLFLKQSLSQPEDRKIEVIARKFSFTPNRITVNRGDRLTIRLISQDVHHGMYIDGYELNTTAYPGSDGNISFHADRGGNYVFRCSVTCGELHPYMVGNLSVRPNTWFFVLLWSCLGLAAFVVRRVMP